MDGSICSEVVEKHSEGRLLTPVSSVGRYPVLSSKKGAEILKKNSSHGLNTEVLSGKEAECARELRSTETRKSSSFSSPTISSSRKIRQKGKRKSPFLLCPLLDQEQYTLIKFVHSA